MQDRRKGDRRHYDRRPGYPLIDSDGNRVDKNRRRVVDRRYHELTVDELAQDEQPQATVQTLYLEYRDMTLELTPESEAVVIGRGSGSDLLIDSKAASRKHARIEYRDGDFVLVDRSTNGTYIRNGSGEPVHLVRSEWVLSGTGDISCGRPLDDANAPVVHFSHED